MPQSVTYIARRSLVSGHSVGAAYSINLALTAKDRVRRSLGKTAVALGGQSWTTYHRGEVHWRLTTRPLTLTETRNMREFLDSVEDGQYFTWDPTYIAGASPSDRRNVRLESSSYTESRAVQRGDDQSGDRFVFTLELREV